MDFVLSLISSPAAAELTPALLDRVNHGLDAAGARAGGIVWLDPARAAEFPFAGDDLAVLEEIRRRLTDLPVDVNVLPAAHRRKQLLVSDMDATAIIGETLDELSTYTPHKAEIDNLTRQSVNGLMSFADTLVARVRLMQGLGEDAFARTWDTIEATPGMKTAIATMRANGAYAALVSGGFTAFTQTIADMVGFNENRANRLIAEGGKFVGRVEEPILGAEAKLSSLIELRDARKLGKAQTLAAGDGANDLPMLREAGLGVAYRAKPAVAAAADARIDHSDLTALLYVQGYAREDFVA